MRRAVLIAVLGAVVAAIALAAWWTRREPWRDPVVPPPPLKRALAAFDAGDMEAGVGHVRTLLNEWDAPSWEPRARILAGTRLDGAGLTADALDILPRALDPSAPLAAHGELLRARALSARGRHADAAACAERAAGVDGFPEREEALLTWAGAMEAAGRTAEAVARLGGDRSVGLRLEAARIAARAADTAAARRLLAGVVLDTEAGEASERALADLVAFIPDPHARFSPEERAMVAPAALRWVGQKKAAQAIELVRAAIPPSAPPGARTPPEALAEALALTALGSVGEARTLVSRAAQGDPETRDGARYLGARLDALRGRGAQYRAGLESLARSPGRSTWKLAALRDLAEIADGRPSHAALAAYRRYRVAAGEQADPVALFREGWVAFGLSRRSEAAAGFSRVLALRGAPPGVQAAALYWTGRVLEQAGDDDGARRRYEETVARFGLHYYGGAAERRLGRPPPTLPDRPPDPVAAEQAGDAGRWLVAARELRSVDLWDAAAAAYRGAAAEASDRLVVAIALEAAEGALDAASGTDAVAFVALAVGDRDTGDPARIPRRFWRVLYPAPGAAELEGAARSAGFDPRLVAAIIMEESAFNPLAVSSVGARGLLQLMPTTAAELARGLGMRDFRSDRLFEPAVNLKLGAAYLKRLSDRLGSVPVVLAAYNAGPARAQRWLLPGDRADAEAFVERIPIPATRIYVKRILAAERMYRIVWNEGLGG